MFGAIFGAKRVFEQFFLRPAEARAIFFVENVHRVKAKAKFRRVAADVRRMVFFHREGARVPEGAGGRRRGPGGTFWST